MQTDLESDHALPPAQLHSKGSQTVSPRRGWRQRRPLTPARVLRGVLLGPLVGYMLVGTTLLYGVYLIESAAIWLAAHGYRLGLVTREQRKWHESSMWLVLTFPLAVPPLALRGLLMVAVAGVSVLLRQIEYVVSWLVRLVRSLGRLWARGMAFVWQRVKRFMAGLWQICSGVRDALQALLRPAHAAMRSWIAWVRTAYREAWAAMVAVLRRPRQR